MKLPNRLADLRSLMKDEIVPETNRMLLRHWDTKGAAYGHTWAPWAEATLQKRLRKGNVEKGILRDTDHLFKTLFRERSADSRLRAIPGGIRLALNVGVRYAILHQKGVPERNLPIRQVIPDPLPPSFVKRVKVIIGQFVRTGKVTT